MPATLYYDLASPYAYLAVARAADVLPEPPRLQPVLAGAIFAHRGRGSWAHTPERDARVAEIEGRARRYGLPPLAWPPGWPMNALRAMRAAVWADRLGAGEAFARAGYRAAFAEGIDLADVDALRAVAAAAGLPAAELDDALADPAIKAALRAATDAAIARGVRGVPTLATTDGRLLFGDDRLEEAAPGSVGR
jgi:2-hydroxychromene-2-carboxylate isomerase